jgi:hypothetical protein
LEPVDSQIRPRGSWLAEILRRPWWAGLGVILATAVALFGYFMTASGPPSYSNNGTCNAQGTGNTVTCSGPSPGQTSGDPSDGSVPADDIGSWEGLITARNGTSFSLIMNIHEGTSGNTIGTFTIPTLDCQGTIQLNTITALPLAGKSVPAVDMSWDMTQNQLGECATGEALIFSTSGTELAYKLVASDGLQGSVQGSLASPLASGDLSH